MTCRKKRYRDHLAALIGLASTQRPGRDGRARPRRAEVRAYHCPNCGGWHLTSQPARATTMTGGQ